MIKVSPSVLSANFADLATDIRALKPAGVEYIHIDVMDGNFVPNMSFAFPIVKAIRQLSDLVLDVHLMIDRPVRYVEEFCRSGADILTIHVEADTEENNLEALRKIRACGVKAAISAPRARNTCLSRSGTVTVMNGVGNAMTAISA